MCQKKREETCPAERSEEGRKKKQEDLCGLWMDGWMKKN